MPLEQVIAIKVMSHTCYLIMAFPQLKHWGKEGGEGCYIGPVGRLPIDGMIKETNVHCLSVEASHKLLSYLAV